ncbi:MAG: hypothetical protein H7333_11185 [Bdellovibrionales bacterium]|nr:hypothetical protein [Oligoflexia bacterium]
MSQKKQDRGSSKHKFFVDWVLEHVRENLKLLAILMLISFGASMGYTKITGNSIQKSFATPDPSESQVPSSMSSPESHSADGTAANFNSAGFTSQFIPSGTAPANGDLAGQDQLPASPAELTVQSATSRAPGTASYASGNSAPGPAAAADAKAPASPKDSSSSDPANPGVTYNGSPIAPASAATGGNSGNTVGQNTFVPGSSGFTTSNFPVAGGFFSVTTGGDIATATGMRVDASFGEVTSSGIQTAPGMSAISGMKGVLYQ